MADSPPAGLTPEQALNIWTGMMGTGWLGAALLWWLKVRAERRKDGTEAGKASGPVLPPTALGAIGEGLRDILAAERLSVERFDRLEAAIGDLGRKLERLFEAAGRHHGETGEYIRRLGDRLVERIDKGFDENRDRHHAIEDDLRAIRDRLGRD